MIKPEDGIVRRDEVINAQQVKIENLSERVSRLETMIDIVTSCRLALLYTRVVNKLPENPVAQIRQLILGVCFALHHVTSEEATAITTQPHSQSDQEYQVPIRNPLLYRAVTAELLLQVFD